jgi:phosphatidate cytidylyltransferase
MPSTRFQPTLPDLQAPPASTGLRPQDRKRKASHDLVASPLHKESKIQEDQVEKPRPVGSSPKIVGLPPAELDVNAERAKRKQNAITRTIWTLIMIGGFIGTNFPSSCKNSQPLYLVSS